MTVAEVIDGDTFMGVAPGGAARMILLRGFDAPGLHEAGGARAKAHLEWLLPPESAVDADIAGRDVYGRTIAAASTGGADLSPCAPGCGCPSAAAAPPDTA